MDKPLPGNNVAKAKVGDQTKTPEDIADLSARGEDQAENSLAAT